MFGDNWYYYPSVNYPSLKEGAYPSGDFANRKRKRGEAVD